MLPPSVMQPPDRPPAHCAVPFFAYEYITIRSGIVLNGPGRRRREETAATVAAGGEDLLWNLSFQFAAPTRHKCRAVKILITLKTTDVAAAAAWQFNVTNRQDCQIPEKR
jgi:hypothetical protein